MTSEIEGDFNIKIVLSKELVDPENYEEGDILFLFRPSDCEVYEYELQTGFGEHWPTNQETRWNFKIAIPYPDSANKFLDRLKELLP